MADYAGAKAAILARFQEHWTRTPIAVPNGPDIEKTGPDGDLLPWVYFEVVSADSSIKGVGRPGDHQWVYDGLIQTHVFVPVGSGTALADELAVAAGEIFRAAEFYREAPGCCVRSWSPRCDDGGSGADDGNWWRVTCTVPFEYLHRG